jgi:hypothetical protein
MSRYLAQINKIIFLIVQDIELMFRIKVSPQFLGRCAWQVTQVTLPLLSMLAHFMMKPVMGRGKGTLRAFREGADVEGQIGINVLSVIRWLSLTSLSSKHCIGQGLGHLHPSLFVPKYLEGPAIGTLYVCSVTKPFPIQTEAR